MEPTIYLNFKGNCREAMTLYAETLGGTVLGVFTNAEAPSPEERMPGGDHLVMNMSIRLGSAVVMGSDAPDAWYSKPQGFSVSITPTSMEEFDRIYATLSQDAERIMMAPAETFWADRFAMFVDRFGTPWMLIIEGSKRAT